MRIGIGVVEDVVVAPFTGAWIEIFTRTPDASGDVVVAPISGAGLEIAGRVPSSALFLVAPIPGAWI